MERASVPCKLLPILGRVALAEALSSGCESAVAVTTSESLRTFPTARVPLSVETCTATSAVQ